AETVWGVKCSPLRPRWALVVPKWLRMVGLGGGYEPRRAPVHAPGGLPPPRAADRQLVYQRAHGPARRDPLPQSHALRRLEEAPEEGRQAPADVHAHLAHGQRPGLLAAHG